MAAIQLSQPAVPVERPWPLVGLSLKTSMRWLLNMIMWVLLLAIGAYVGVQIAAAVYYLLFQVIPAMNAWWHQMVPDENLRHNIRDVWEGLMGGLLAQQLVWNHYHKRMYKPATRLDRIEMFLRIPNIKDTRQTTIGLLACPVLVLLYAIPGFLIMRWTILAFGHDMGTAVAAIKVPSSVSGSGFLNPMLDSYTANWPEKLMGFGAAYFWGRRPVKGAFDDVQLWFARRRVATDKSYNWYHKLLLPPAYQARYNEELKKGQSNALRKQHAWLTWLIRAGVALGVGLAIFGWYILNYIAK